MSWKTKPTDRFVLRFIKVYVSAPVSALLVHSMPGIRPAALTFLAACLGISGGIAFGLGFAWIGGLLAAVAQILDGVDGQVARLTDKVSSEGAFLDSVLDRYMDFSLLFGILFHCLRYSEGVGLSGVIFSSGWLIVLTGLAAAGCSQVSYAEAAPRSLSFVDFSHPSGFISP
jgi:phosphatidylglycerophosphate synthase